MDTGPVTKIEPEIAARLAKQRYHLVGDHGGVKVCHWTKQSLIADSPVTRVPSMASRVMVACRWRPMWIPAT